MSLRTASRHSGHDDRPDGERNELEELLRHAIREAEESGRLGSLEMPEQKHLGLPPDDLVEEPRDHERERESKNRPDPGPRCPSERTDRIEPHRPSARGARP